MKKKTAPPKYTPEVRERAIRLLEEVRAQHPSDRAAIQAIASKIGCNPETLRAWYRKHQDAQNPAALSNKRRTPASRRSNAKFTNSNAAMKSCARPRLFFARAEPGRKQQNLCRKIKH